MNTLSAEKRTRVISALVEGNSIRATVRMTGVAKNTIVKLLAEIGTACEQYQDHALRNLLCKRVQCDEIWSFCYAKQKNVPAEKQGQFGYGDVWTWTALCADTKTDLLLEDWHARRFHGLRPHARSGCTARQSHSTDHGRPSRIR